MKDSDIKKIARDIKDSDIEMMYDNVKKLYYDNVIWGLLGKPKPTDCNSSDPDDDINSG